MDRKLDLERYFEEFYEKIKQIIKTRAPIKHSSEDIEYGIGSTTEYGHVKVEEELLNSPNPVRSSTIKNNIDTINGKIDNMTVDTELSTTSQKPVENRVITDKFNNLDGSTIKLNGTTNQTLEDAINVRIPGKDGKGLEFIFKRFSSLVDDWSNPPTEVINPATLSPNQTDDYIPEGWTDDQEEVTWEIPYQYVSTRTKEVIPVEQGGDGYTAYWGKFTEPKLWSVYGEKPFCHLRYADVPNPVNWNDTYSEPQTDTISDGKNYHKYEGYLWNEEQVLSNENKDPTLFTWRIYRPTIGVAGQEGSFLHIAYADNEAGEGFNQFEGDYLGTCVTWEEEDPDDPDLYNWVKIKGNQGIAGITTEFVYYTTDVENYTSLPTNIKNVPELKRWCERPYGVTEENPYCYVSVRDSVDMTWSTPVLWAKYGEKGNTGIGILFAYYTTDSNNFTGVPTGELLTGNNKKIKKWCDTPYPTSENYPYLYISTKTTESDTWSQASLMSKYGIDGSHGTGFEYAYYTTATEPNPIKPTTVYSDNVIEKWQKNPVPIQGNAIKIYISYRTKTDTSYTDWSDGVLFSEKGDQGVKGFDGKGFEMIFYPSNTEIKNWNQITTYKNPSKIPITETGFQEEDYVPTSFGWYDDPQGVSLTSKYEYASVRTSDKNGQWSKFTVPSLHSKFGDDGLGIEFIYKRTTTSSSPNFTNSQNLPSFTGTVSGKKFTDDDFVPSGWEDDPIGVDENNQFEWVSQRTKVNGVWTKFTDPTLWAKYGEKGEPGEDGADGVGLEMIFCRNNSTINAPEFIDNQNLASFEDTVDGKLFSNDDFVPENWEDDQQGVDSSHTVEWVSMRFKRIGEDGKTAEWTDFNTPKVWATFSKDGRGVESIEEKYVLYNNYTGLPNNVTWLDNRPQVPNGMFLWIKSVITYTDGNTDNTDPYCATGQDGTGVHYIYFCKNDLNSINAPQNSLSPNVYSNTGTSSDYGRWIEDPVAIDINHRYIFISKSTTHAYDSNHNKYWVDFSEPVLWARFAIDGKSITRVVNYYVASNSSTNAPSTGWKTNISQVTDFGATKKYLWNKERSYSGNAESDFVSESNAVVIAYWTEDGSPGKGISDIEEHYVISSSDTNPTKDYSWKSTKDTGFTMPKTTSAYKYLWNYETIYFTEGEPYNNEPRIIGTHGETGASIVFAYYTSDNANYSGSPTGSLVTGNNKGNNKWCDTPYPTSASYPYLYVSTKTTASDSTWSTASLMSKYGLNGNNGTGYEYAYYTTSGTPNPTIPDTVLTTGMVNSWQKTPVAMTDSATKIYISYRTKTGSSYSSWSTGALFSVKGDTGDRGTSNLSITTAPSSYTTPISGFTPKYKISLSTVKTQSGVSEVLVGDSLRHSYYIYPVGYVDSDNVYCGSRVSIRGATGSAGASITSVVNYYCASSDGTNAPTTGWDTTIPSISSSKKYLWNYEQSKSGDTVISETDPVIIAYYTTDGVEGRGISSVQEYYGISDSPSTEPASWILDNGSNTLPVMTNTDRYLWNYEKITYTKGSPSTSTTQPAIIGVYGDKGDDGVDGDKFYEISTQPPTYSNASYPERKYRLNLYTINVQDINGADLSNIKIGDIFKYSTYLYPILNVWHRNSSNWWVYFSERTELKGDQGIKGYDGVGFEMVFKLMDSENPTWTNSNNPSTISTSASGFQSAGYIPFSSNSTNKWTNDPSGVSAQKKYEFASVRTSDENGVWSAFSTPSLFAKFGDDGIGIEYIYCVNNSTTPPTFTNSQNLASFSGTVNNKKFNDDDFVPDNWTDDPQGVDSTNKFEWVSQRTKSNGQWSNFSSPTLWAKYSERGTGAVNISSTPTSNATTVDGYTVKYNYNLSTAKNESGLSEILIGDYLRYSYYIYPIVYIKGNLIYTSNPISIRGKTGKPVKKVVNYYLATSYSSGVSSSNGNWGNWSKTIQTIDTNKPYLWNYEKSYSDNNETELISETSPVIIGRYGTDGSPGAPGRGITDVIEEYALTQNTTQPANTDWDGDVPTMTSTNKYLWNKETIKYTSGNDDISIKIIGVYGDKGDTGKGISNVENEYATNNSSSAPTSGWTTSLSSLTFNANNPYLWNREKITYTNPSSTQYTTATLIGEYGKIGENISSITEKYGLSNDKDTTPSVWQDTPPKVTNENRYLWNYEIINYSKPSTTYSTTAKIIGVYGDTGADGKDGLGLEHIFYSSTTPLEWKLFYDEGITGSETGTYQLSNATKSVDANGTTMTASSTSAYLYIVNSSTKFPLDFCIEFDIVTTGTTYSRFGISDDTNTAVYSLQSAGHYIFKVTSTGITATLNGNSISKLSGNNPTGNAKAYFYITSRNRTTKFKNLKIESMNNNPHFWEVVNTDNYVKSGTGWTDDASGVDEINKYEYCSIRRKEYDSDGITAKWVEFDTPSLWSKYGDAGDDGDGVQMIFCRTTSITNRPIFTDGQNSPTYEGTVKVNGVDYHYQDKNYVPEGWTSNQSGVNENDKYEWVSMRERIPEETSEGVWGAFSNPSLWASYSEKGKDGTDLTGSEIMTKINGESIDAQTIGGINPNELVTTKLLDNGQVNSSLGGFYRVFKMGRLVILIFKDYVWAPPNTDYNQTVVQLPAWAKSFVSPRVYFMNTPHGESLSVSSGGVFTCTAKSTGNVSISGTFLYIGNEEASVNTNISFIGETNNSVGVTTGNSITILLKDTDNKVLANKSVVFLINGGTYTRTTGSDGKASLTINLSNGTYNDLEARFDGDATYNPSTTNKKTLQVSKISTGYFHYIDNKTVRVTTSNSTTNGVPNGDPIRNLNCKANLEGTFYYLTTDYNGNLNVTSILSTFKGSKNITFSKNDSKITTLNDAGFTFTGTKLSQDYTLTLSPSGTGGSVNDNYSLKAGSGWNYATTGSLTIKNDGAYAITDVLDKNAKAGDLYVSFNTGIPTNGKIKNIQVTVRYKKETGWYSTSHGSFEANVSKIKVVSSGGTNLSNVNQQNFITSYIGQNDYDWRELTYTWNLSNNMLSNANNDFLYPAVVISGIQNTGGGGGNYMSARFCIDFVQMVVTYEA